MWRSTVAAFAFGFVAGMAVLTAALWFSGGLRRPWAASSRTVAAAAPKEQAAPAEASPPAPSSPPAPARVPNPDHPIVPVQGVSAEELVDTFNDKRDGRRHDALDIPAARDTPVIAAAEGNVVKLFQSKLGGLTVYEFDDSQRYCYYYAHLGHYAAGLKEGTLLRQGQVLGYVGTTGNAPPDLPHLHFEVHELGPEKKWWQGRAVDPIDLLR